MDFIHSRYKLENLKSAIKEELYLEPILYYKKDLINEFLKLVNNQEMVLQNLDPKTNSFQRDIVTLELDRIKYYLKKYFRTRNYKIEKNILYIFKNDLSRMLSKAEFDFAVGYYKLLSQQFEEGLFCKVSKKYGEQLFVNNVMEKDRQTSMSVPIVDNPDETKYVFVRFLEKVEKLGLDKSVVIEVEKGTIFFVPYKYIKSLLENGKCVII